MLADATIANLLQINEILIIKVLVSLGGFALIFLGCRVFSMVHYRSLWRWSAKHGYSSQDLHSRSDQGFLKLVFYRDTPEFMEPSLCVSGSHQGHVFSFYSLTTGIDGTVAKAGMQYGIYVEASKPSAVQRREFTILAFEIGATPLHRVTLIPQPSFDLWKRFYAQGALPKHTPHFDDAFQIICNELEYAATFLTPALKSKLAQQPGMRFVFAGNMLALQPASGVWEVVELNEVLDYASALVDVINHQAVEPATAA